MPQFVLSPNESPLESPGTTDTTYLDPFTALPESYRPKSKWKSFVEKMKKSNKTVEGEEQKTSARLTEKNLTQHFNPDYQKEVEIYRSQKRYMRAKRKSVASWMEGLP